MTELILWLIGGLVILTIGAELLVRGAVGLAIAARISPLVVGLTVVAYGTGAPELVISLHALSQGQMDIAIGNVIGSNIFNILVTLGLSALIVPLVVSSQLIRFETPLLLVVTLLLAAFAWDGTIDFWQSLVLTGLLLVYTAWAILKSRRDEAELNRKFKQELQPAETRSGSLGWKIALLLVGTGLLVLGARFFLDSAVKLAVIWGLSELVIGITLVAGGTSLPEVATSVVAALRGQRDIAVGNAIGSSLFNILGVLGITGLFASEGLPVHSNVILFDLPILIAVTFACLPIFFTGQCISRWEGALFFFYYLAYTTFLILAATESVWQATYLWVMLGIVVPLTVLTIGLSVIGQFRRPPPDRLTD